MGAKIKTLQLMIIFSLFSLSFFQSYQTAFINTGVE